jgi:hypothetical protein
MFFKYKKIIYFVLFILLMVICFSLVLSIHKSSTVIAVKATDKGDEGKKKKVFVTPSPVQKNDKNLSAKHDNYNKVVNLKGNNYSFSYKITNAKFVDKGVLNFTLKTLKNEDNKIVRVNLAPIDDFGTLLNFDPVITDKENQLSYNVTGLESVKVLNLKVIVFTKEMYDDKYLEINTLPFGSTKLNLKLITEETIKNLKEGR